MPTYFVFSLLISAQSIEVSAPSRDEVSELLSKADQQVASFDEAVKQVQADLERERPKLFGEFVEAAMKTRMLIRAVKGKSPSAYSLVGLLSALDDLALDASKAASIVMLADNGRIDAETQTRPTLLWAAENSCADISELILHAALRLIQVEENALESLLRKRK